MSDEMTLATEWLSSSVRLCELRTDIVDQPEEEKGLRYAVFNSSTFPPPDFQRSSVLTSLEVYTQALWQAGRAFTAGNQHPSEPSPAGGIRAEGINRFAHSLAEDILQSARGQWETAQTEEPQHRGTRIGPPCHHVSGGTDPLETGLREGLYCRPTGGPEGLSCTILKSVLEEVAGERGSRGPRHRSKSAPDPMGRVSQGKTVDVSGGWRTGCRLSSCRLLQDQSEVEAHMDLGDERVSHQSNWRRRYASNEHPVCWFSGNVAGQEAKMEDRSSQRCFPGSPTDAGASCSILAPTGLPSKGSLDYPDAPPTTPLLSNMIKSHDSFHRKLKGSLANEFLPSPPPPTPKYLTYISEEDRLGLRNAEFVARLMRSLSLECSERGALGVEEEWTDGAQSTERSPHEMHRLSAYANKLSAKIISSATTICAAHFEGQVSRTDPGKWLQLAAEQWANEVMAASFQVLMKKDKTGWAGSRPPVQAQQMAEKWPTMQPDVAVGHSLEDISPSEASRDLKSPSQRRTEVPHASWIEDLCSFAGHLIADILMQALAEVETLNLGHCQAQEIAKELCSSIVAEAVTMTTWHQNACCRTPGSQEESCNPCNGRLGAMASMSPQPGMTAPSYAIFSVEAAVRDPVQEVVRLDMGLIGASADQDLRLGNPMGSEVRAFLDRYACLGVQELQGMLLWATASNLGSPTLNLTVQDVQLQAEFCMLANSTLQVGWTVGDLMTSLWRYCELQDNLGSSGHSLNDTSLLKYLQETLVGEMTDFFPI